MNRIRRVGRAYQVLLTPHQKYNVGFEYLLGSWTDDSITGFEVRDYGSYREAECEAIEHPDINWDQLVDYHKDAYTFLKDYLQKFLDKIGITVDFKYKLMTPEQTKQIMFERVLKGQKLLVEKQITTGFRTVYDMNDIISFRIINPWAKNLNELEIHLMNNKRLNIFRKISKNGIVQLVGRTDIGTTYEIILISSVLNNWFEWRKQNGLLSSDLVEAALRNCIKTQKLIDAAPSLR
jgi:hypothetical protein